MKIIGLIVVLFFGMPPKTLISQNGIGSSYNFFPVVDGMVWHYKVTENYKQHTQKVMMHIPGKSENYDFALKNSGKNNNKYYYKTAGDTVYLQKIHFKHIYFPRKVTIHFNPPMPVFIYSPHDHETTNWHFKWSGKVTVLGISKKIEAKGRFIGFETLKTNIGVIDCMKIHQSFSYGNNRYTGYSWYAEHLGLIKVLSDDYNKQLYKFNQTED